MSDFVWTRNLVEKLILHYQIHDNLYNANDSDYLNKVRRADSINDITMEMQMLDNRINSEIIKSKINNLRTQYVRELRKVENCKKNGTAVEEYYMPKFWCYDQLHFLKSYCSIRKFQTNTGQENVLNLALENTESAHEKESPLENVDESTLDSEGLTHKKGNTGIKAVGECLLRVNKIRRQKMKNLLTRRRSHASKRKCRLKKLKF